MFGGDAITLSCTYNKDLFCKLKPSSNTMILSQCQAFSSYYTVLAKYILPISKYVINRNPRKYYGSTNKVNKEVTQTHRTP